jgi:hypothetical protein
MMGHREKFKGFAIYDGLSPRRKLYHWRRSEIAKLKRAFWKRARKDARREAEKEAAE